MKNIKQYKRLQNIMPKYWGGKSAGFKMPGMRALGYEPGEQGDSSGWSNFAGNDLSPAIRAGRRAATQANLSGMLNGASVIGQYAADYTKQYAAQKAAEESIKAGASALASTAAPITGALADKIGYVGQVLPSGEFQMVEAPSNVAGGASNAAGSTASVAGIALGGLTALYNGLGLVNTLQDMPVVDTDTMKSTQSQGTAMANGVKYDRLGRINVSKVNDLQDVYDSQTNAALRSSEIGMGAGVGGAVGSIFGPVGGLIGSGIGAGIGGLISLFTGVDQKEEAQQAARDLNVTTDLVNQNARDVAASKGIRRMYTGMYANFGKVKSPRLRTYKNGKNSIVKQFNTNGMLLPLNRKYGNNIG